MIKDNLELIKKSLDDLCSGRPNPIIVGVTKHRSIEQIKELIECGITDLGENRVQEFLEKYPYLPDTIRWHMIGTLQKNKVKYLIGKVFLIHSVDSLELLDEINKQSEKKELTTDVLIELNISEEESKHGFSEIEIKSVIEHASCLKNINVKGLMCMAPINANEDDLNEIFGEMSIIFKGLMKESKKYDNISMKYLSMGMSRDYKIAVENNSNMIRIGTNLFL